MKAVHHKVFFVDDEQSMRTTIAEMLGKEGYNVTCFANAKACLSEVEHTGCNLLISDVKMPEMDGIQLLSRIKRVAPWIPVILITGYGSIQMAVYTTKIGAAEFIEKPFSRSALVNKVKEILSRSEDLIADALKLTKTEKKILKLILDGCSNKEIAVKVRCAVRTVEFHHTNIYRKFGVDNAVELTKKAMAMFLPKNGN
jgi:two-component system, LuxR family, response regulator FixJ